MHNFIHLNRVTHPGQVVFIMYVLTKPTNDSEPRSNSTTTVIYSVCDMAVIDGSGVARGGARGAPAALCA